MKLALILPPLSVLYSAATRARLFAYRREWLSVSKLPAPVISVGNLTTGGTGKTPLVEWVCRVVANNRKKVCVLTRGYGRANPDSQILVSNGGELLADALAAGDEPRLLAEKLLGVAAVIANPNRFVAGTWAIEIWPAKYLCSTMVFSIWHSCATWILLPSMRLVPWVKGVCFLMDDCANQSPAYRAQAVSWSPELNKSMTGARLRKPSSTWRKVFRCSRHEW